MERCRLRIRRATAVLLVSSAVLILPGLAGVGSSLSFIGVLTISGIALALIRTQLASAGTALSNHLGQYVSDLWMAPLVVAAVLAVFSDASAPELQALGGFVGFAGMLNYFLTPVYLFVYEMGLRTVRAVAG